MNILEKLKEFFYYNKVIRKIKSTWYSIYYGIGNIITYAPTVWKDRDWDYIYFYDLMYFKLSRMLEHHKKYNCFTSQDDTVSELQEALDILDRLIDNEYDTIEINKIFDKYGLSHDTLENYMKSHKILNESHNDDEITKAFETAYDIHKRDLDKLFKLIANNVEGWWT